MELGPWIVWPKYFFLIFTPLDKYIHITYTMCEIWKSIDGFEGLYEVSNIGNVRRLDSITSKANIKIPNLSIGTDISSKITNSKLTKDDVRKIRKLRMTG